VEQKTIYKEASYRHLSEGLAGRTMRFSLGNRQVIHCVKQITLY